jgi:DNA-binding PadR family transcriptional regulator
MKAIHILNRLTRFAPACSDRSLAPLLEEGVMRTGNLRFALLGLVAASRDGLHGYRLKSDLDVLCDEFWELNYGRIYRILDELERCGDLSAEAQSQELRPARRVYRITERGRQTLDDWLLQPMSENPRPLRDELSLKMLFLGKRDAETITEMVRSQRRVYLTQLARVSKRRARLEKSGYDMKVTSLVIEGAEMRVRADLAWLEHIERTLLRSF